MPPWCGSFCYPRLCCCLAIGSGTCQPLWSGCCRVSTSMEKAMRPRIAEGSKAVLVAGLLAVLALAVSTRVEAAGGDRAAYVDQLEGICKPRVAATQRAVKGVEGDVQGERFPVAA